MSAQYFQSGYAMASDNTAPTTVAQRSILLTHSYFLAFDQKEFIAMMPYAPLGTLYAASSLRQAGYNISIFDSMLAKSESGIIPILDTQRPDIVVVYDDDFNYLTKMCLKNMRDAAFRMIALARSRGASVIVHGPDSADHASEYLEKGANFVILGEGEQTLLELVAELRSGSPGQTNIRGLAYLKDDAVIMTQKRDPLNNWDLLPLPSRDLLDIERYRTLWTQRHGYFSMNIVTTRGCPFHCNWCAKPVYGQVYNSRSPQHVVMEMLHLKSEYHPDHLWFCDDIFGLKPGWVEEFAKLVTKADAKIPFKCLGRADLLLKGKAVESLAAAGCKTVWIGAESGSQKILDAMEKGTTVEQIYLASAKLKAHGIEVGFFLQYGYPGETREDIELTMKMVKDCKPDDIGISVSYPLPGTTFYENVKRQLGDKQNWVDSKDLDPMFPGTYSADYYRVLHTVTHKQFRIWQGMDLFKTALKHPWRIDRRSWRRIAAMGYHMMTLPAAKSKMHSFL